MSKKTVIAELTIASLSLVAIFVLLLGVVGRFERAAPFAPPSPTESLTMAKKCIESAQNDPAELARLAACFEEEAKRLYDEAWDEKAERLRTASENFRKLAKLLLGGKVEEILSGSETGILLSAFENRALARSAESLEGRRPAEDKRAETIALLAIILGLCTAVLLFARSVIDLLGQLIKMRRQRSQATDGNADK